MAGIDAATRCGAVSLTVSDLERSVASYRDAIGLRELERGAGRASMGAGDAELVRLVEVPGAPRASRNTGLFHLAIRVPEREDGPGVRDPSGNLVVLGTG